MGEPVNGSSQLSICSSIGFGIMLFGCFTIITRMRFKINSKFVRLSRSLSLNSSSDHSKYPVVQNDFWLVRLQFCIFGYFLSLVLSHCSTNPYEIRATTSSSSLLWDGKRSLNRHKIQLLVIYVWTIFFLKKNVRSLRSPCFTQIEKLFFANFLSSIFFLSTFYQP